MAILATETIKQSSLESLLTGGEVPAKPPALDMRRADVRLLRELVSRAPLENTFECAGVHQCWSLSKHQLLRAQENGILRVGSQADEAEGQLG